MDEYNLTTQSRAHAPKIQRRGRPDDDDSDPGEGGSGYVDRPVPVHEPSPVHPGYSDDEDLMDFDPDQHAGVGNPVMGNNLRNPHEEDDNFNDPDYMAAGNGGSGAAAGSGQQQAGPGWNTVGHEWPVHNPDNRSSRTARFSKRREFCMYTFRDTITPDDQRLCTTTQHMDEVTPGDYPNMYRIPFALRRAALESKDLIKLSKKAFACKIKSIGFKFISIKQNELVVEGSDRNPKLRNKDPNDIQIQYLYDVNGPVKRSIPLNDVFAGERDGQATTHNYLKGNIYSSPDQGNLGKELPKTHISVRMNQAQFDEYNNTNYTLPTNNLDSGLGKDFYGVHDVMKTCSPEALVNKRIHVPYKPGKAWTTLHDPFERPGHYTASWGATTEQIRSRMSYNEARDRQRHSLSTNPRTHFDTSLKFNTTYYETLTAVDKLVPETEGLLDGFPEFFLRIRDEMDLQQDYNRYFTGVIEYYCELEYLPIIMLPRDICNSVMRTKVLIPADYKVDQELREQAYNTGHTRQRTWNKCPTLGFKDHSYINSAASPFNMLVQAATLSYQGQGVDKYLLELRQLPPADGAGGSNATSRYGSRTGEVIDYLNLARFIRTGVENEEQEQGDNVDGIPELVIAGAKAIGKGVKDKFIDAVAKEVEQRQTN